MSLDILFPHLRDFRLLSYSRETRRLVLTCERVTPSEPCPLCGTAAHRIHSRYERTIWDLSVQNVQVLLHLHVRKFYCDQPDCPRRIFTEKPSNLSSPLETSAMTEEALSPLCTAHAWAAWNE